LLPNGTLKTYRDLPHGCHGTHPDLINADLLAFFKGEEVTTTAESPSVVAEPALTE
jgi:non-heme chloroperoxidase